MKYWADTLQYAGIALFAGGLIGNPPSVIGIFWGVFLVCFGFILNKNFGGK